MSTPAAKMSVAIGLVILASYAIAQTLPSTQPTIAVSPAPVAPISTPYFDPSSGTYATGYGRAYYAPPPGAMYAAPAINPADLIDQVSCVIQIDSDIDPNYGGRNDGQTATALLTSSTLKDSAIERMNNGQVQKAKQQIQVQAYSTAPQLVRVTVLLMKGAEPFPPGSANKLMSALCDSLKSAFEASNRASLQVINSRNDTLQKQLDSARERFSSVRAKLRQARDTASGSGYGYDSDNMLSNLMNQKRSNDSELSRARARLAALDPGASPLVNEWDQVVKLRQKQLDDAKKAQQAGKTSASDVTEMEARLAEAKAQLAAIKGSDARSPSRVNRDGEISSLRGQIAELEDRAKNTDEQIARLKDPKVRELQDQIPDLQQQEQQLRNEISDLSSRMDQARRTLRSTGNVTITILDGRPS